MRKLICILLSGSCFSALACPTLEGSYLCRQTDFRVDTVYKFSQQEIDGIWHFEMTATPVGRAKASAFEFKADGVAREITDRVSGIKLKATATCQSEALVVQGESSNPRTGGVVRFSETLSSTPNGDLQNVSLDIRGKLVTEVCARQP